MNINDDEALGLINRLLEGLHQADLTNFGSHLQIVYVASGAQHVENQINEEQENGDYCTAFQGNYGRKGVVR